MNHLNGEDHEERETNDDRVDALVTDSKNAVIESQKSYEHVIAQLEIALVDIKSQGGFFNELAEKISGVVESLKATHGTASNPIDETVFPKANNVHKFSIPEHRR